jgi:hypothetical protein
MARFRYRTIYAWGLREGDWIKAADGRTWLGPVTRVQVLMSRPVTQLWYRRPGPTWNSAPDQTMSQYMQVRIKRPSGR